LTLEVIRGRITLGDVILIATYAVMLGGPMANIGATWAKLQYPIAGLRRVHSVLDRLPDGAATGSTGSLKVRIRTVECRDISVGYDVRAPILERVSITLRHGELAAIAGPSGSGKTTLTYALPRFLEPLAGRVFFNDVDARSYDLDSIRQRIAFVFQQEALFSTTIEDNIRYGLPEASGEQVREAAQRAGAAAFIERLPVGYRTMLGRRGTRLSVGQKQRIAIARALIRDPDVIVLDEPMAPLDYSSEAALMKVLKELAKTRIVLLVAHRPETLSACDVVYFIDGGTVGACGTHRELIGSCAAYSEYLAVTGSEIRG
jgi:ABC-type multidrug transport system fused ATPase/permease subunit